MAPLRNVYKGILFFAVLSLIPLFTNSYQQFIINLIFVNFLVGLGLAVLLGYCGQFAFASSGFMGVGAYTVGLSMVHLGFSFWLSLLIAAVMSLLFAWMVGFVGLRLTRYYLAIATIAFTLLMRFFYVNAGSITFGPSGFNVPKPKLFNFTLKDDHSIYYLLLVSVFLLSVLTINILKSKVGRAFMAIRDAEGSAAAVAINVNHYKMLAFAISGVLGGIAGGLFCVVIGRITPDEYGMTQILFHFLIVVLGGLGNILGLVLSTIIVTVLPEIARAVKDLQEVVYGAVIIVIILFSPDGLYGLVRRFSPVDLREKLHGNVPNNGK
jgi:branched-chain amino acid transport system permease protein